LEQEGHSASHFYWLLNSLNFRDGAPVRLTALPQPALGSSLVIALIGISLMPGQRFTQGEGPFNTILTAGLQLVLLE
jgi:hypothetical protein